MISSKTILIIDDELTERFVLKKLVRKYLPNVKIFTCDDGVQGLEFIRSLKPNIIIFDSALPQNVDNELIKFLIKSKEVEKLPIIILESKGYSIRKELPKNFVQINKSENVFPIKLIDLLYRELDPTIADEKIKYLNNISCKLVNFLSRKVVDYSNLSNKEFREIRSKTILKSLANLFRFVVDQILVGIYLTFFYILLGPADSEENREQQMKDRLQYRNRLYPSIGVGLAAILVIFVQLIVFFSGIIGISFLSPSTIYAAAYTWDGGGTDGTCGGAVGDGNKWSCAANWSLNIVPSINDVITFDSTSTKDSVIDPSFAGTISSITIASSYTGTISMSRSFTVITFIQSGGNFNASNQTLNVNHAVSANFVLNTGANFTASSGITNFMGTVTINGGTFNTNSGTVNFTTSGNSGVISCNNIAFNKVTISNTGTMTVSSNCNFPLGLNPTITSGGNIVLNGTLSGTGTFNKSGANINIPLGGSFSGFTGLNFSGTSTLTIAGANADFSTYTTFAFTTQSNSISVSSGTLTLPNNASVGGSLNASGTGIINAPSGILYSAGGMSLTGSSVFNANGGTLYLNGAYDVGLICNNAVFNLVVINSTNGKQFASNCNIPLGNNPTVNVGSGRIVNLLGTFTGTGTLTHNGGVGGIFKLNSGAVLSGFSGISVVGLTNLGANIDFSSYALFTTTGAVILTGGTTTIPNGATLSSLTVNGGTLSTINGDLSVTTTVTISSGIFNAPTGIFNVGSNFTISGSPTFNNNAGTVRFTGNGVLSCNNYTFNLVLLNGSTTVGSNCNLPLGNNPTTSSVTLSGTLTGSGLLTTAGLTLNTGYSLSGFSGLTTANFASAAPNVDFTTYSPFTVNSLNLQSGILTLPNGSRINSAFTISNGATFNAPSGTMSISATFTHSVGAIFNANNGTVILNGSFSSLNCNNTNFYNVEVNTTLSTTQKVMTGTCNVVNLTLTSGTIIASASPPTTLNITGNFIENSNTQFGTSPMVVNFVGTGTQNITKNTGTFASPINISGSGTVKLLTPLVTNQPCNLNSGIFSLNGQSLTCSAFNVSSVSTLELQGGETVTVPTLASGSVVKYIGNGNSAANAYTLANWAYSNLIIDSTDGTNDTFNFNNNFTPASLTLTSGTIGKSAGATNLTTSGLLTINGATWNPLTLNITANAGITCSSGVFNAATATLAVNGDLNLTGCNMTSPSGTVAITGNFNHTAGTFTHNNGTINLTGNGKAINGSTTFYNLYKITSVADTLNFQAGTTQTVAGTLRLRGISGNLLSTRSLTPGTRFNINSGTYDLGYLDIQDYSNTNGLLIQGLGLNITDSGNNTGWNLHNPLVTSIGPSNLIDGSFTINTTPTLSFSISDPDISDTLKYTIQIDNNSDFNSLEVNNTSALDVGGNLTFISSTLSPGSYYWRVKAIDSSNGESSFFTANNGEIAFKEDFIPEVSNLGESSLVDGSYINTRQPVFNFTISDSDTSDLTEDTIQIDNNSDFSSPEINYVFNQGSLGVKTFTVGQAAGDGIYSAGNANQTLADGAYYWRVKTIDNHSAESDFTYANLGSIAFIVNSAPTVTNLGPADLIDGTYTINKSPLLTFELGDVNTEDTVSYSIQVDNNADFTSPEVEYSSPLLLPGVKMFQIFVELEDGSYYWRVKATDNHSGESIYSNASLDVAFNINTTPEVNNLGSSELVDGSYILNRLPEFSFDINDINSTDTIKFIIQVDDNSDFTSPEIDFTSALISGGNQTYVSNIPLADAAYYWRVKVIDDHNAESEFTNANSGEVAFHVNTTPEVNNLGSSELVDGSYILNRLPEFSFDINDINSTDTIKFIIQVDDNSDFTSLEIDFTSELLPSGLQSFIPTNELPDGPYYWRVKVIDNHNAESEFTTANLGEIAFNINSTPTVSSLGPDNLTNQSYTINRFPEFIFTTSDVNLADTIKYIIQVDDNSDFSSPEIDFTSALISGGNQTYVSNIPLADAAYYWRVKMIDDHNAESEFINANSGEVAFNINSTPTVSDLGPDNLINQSYTINRQPEFNFTTEDVNLVDTVQYNIQLANNIDFISPEVDFTSELLTNGLQSFIPTNELPDGAYYWRVRVIDNHNAESEFTTANLGEIAFNVNSIPVVTNLGPLELVDKSFTLINAPSFNFDLSDVNVGDTINYTFQLSLNKDFSPLIVDYTSVLEDAGTKIFKLGQLAEGGIYTVGEEGQELAVGNFLYYWRVKATDSNGAESMFAFANEEDFSFGTDIVSPTGMTSIEEVNHSNINPYLVNLVINSNDNLSGVTQMQISESLDFSNAVWVEYQDVTAITLTNGSGTKNEYVRLKDKAENISAVLSASIVLVIQVPRTPDSNPTQTQTIPPAIEVADSINVYDLNLTVVDKNDQAVSNVLLTLDSGIESTTDLNGVATIKNISAGVHTLTIKYGEYIDKITFTAEGTDLSINVRILLDIVQDKSTSPNIDILLLIIIFAAGGTLLIFNKRIKKILKVT